eukprot:4816695-Pyramimonas_sp.AAC.3
MECSDELDFSKHKPHNFSAGLPPELGGVAVSIAAMLLAQPLLRACAPLSEGQRPQVPKDSVDFSGISLLDPCCGSGTVVYEAWKRGIQVRLYIDRRPEALPTLPFCTTSVVRNLNGQYTCITYNSLKSCSSQNDAYHGTVHPALILDWTGLDDCRQEVKMQSRAWWR